MINDDLVAEMVTDECLANVLTDVAVSEQAAFTVLLATRYCYLAKGVSQRLQRLVPDNVVIRYGKGTAGGYVVEAWVRTK